MPEEKKFEYRGRYTRFFENIDEILIRMAPDPQHDDAGILHSAFSTGEMAELRRMHPEVDEARPPVFWKLLCRYGIIGSDTDERNSVLSAAEERRWAALIQGMAMTAELCRDAKDDFGKALGGAEEGGDTLSKRFDQLMRATPERFLVLLRHMLKLALSKNCAFSWDSLASLILTTDEQKLSRIRTRLTQSFYSALEKKQYAETNGDNAETL